MATRGQGRGRRRGLGRPRGSTNKPKTMMWEWETYKPAPEIYNSLWHLRQAPPIITRNLSNECPIPNAESRIVARRQTEDGYNRNFYIVKVRYLDRSFDDGGSAGKHIRDDEDDEETEEVDMSVILRYVSRRELERFENAEFRAEAEAEAALKRAEAEELARHRLEKNARIPGKGRGAGMMLDPETGELSRSSGRRTRGRGRGKGRGRERGRGTYAMGISLDGQMLADLRLGDENAEDATDVEAFPALDNEDALQRIIAETESEEDEEEIEDIPSKQASPDFMRSAFVANSALPVSPVQRRLSNVVPIIHHSYPEPPDLDDSDAQSMSSAAEQLFAERRMREPSESDDIEQDTGHRSKRPRTESTLPSRRLPVLRKLAVVIPSSRRPAPAPQPPPESSEEDDPEESDEDIPTRAVAEPMDVEHEEEEQDSNEYVVERILDHSYREAVKYYLVKWEGYEDATDWVVEDELESVAELIEEYKEKIRRKKLK